MKTEAYSYLKDIEIAATSIFEFLKDCPTFEIYLSDKKTRRAVEREFEIIGEAMNKLLKLEPTINISDARLLIDFRNFVIHEYNRIDNNIMWAAIQDKLPTLLKEVQKFFLI
jgi:uncharacterized protein with HEPN domain